MSIPIDDEEGFFGEYQDESFVRGWDSEAHKLGNPIARRRAPLPGTVDYYFRGQSLAQRVLRAFKRRGTR